MEPGARAPTCEGVLPRAAATERSSASSGARPGRIWRNSSARGPFGSARPSYLPVSMPAHHMLHKRFADAPRMRHCRMGFQITFVMADRHDHITKLLNRQAR